MAKPTLIYFASRGRAEIIRLVLVEAGVDWQEHPVGKDTPPQGGRPTDFAALKQSGLLPFGAVPVWEEPDGFRLAQSMAIVRYLGGAHGLGGKTSREAALVDQVLGAYEDVRAELRRLVTIDPDRRAALREELATQSLPRWAGCFDRLLASNRDGTGFLVGDSLTVADLALWYLLELMGDNGFQAAAAFPRLGAFAARIAARPRLAAYLASPRRFPFIALPA
jgi:glutathione S-transferase